MPADTPDRFDAIAEQCLHDMMSEPGVFEIGAVAILEVALRSVAAEATAAERRRCEMAVRCCLDESQRQSVAMQLVVVKALAAIRDGQPPAFVACEEDRPVPIKVEFKKPLTLLDPDAPPAPPARYERWEDRQQADSSVVALTAEMEARLVGTGGGRTKTR